MLLRLFTILTSASNTTQEQSHFASKAYSYAVAMLQGTLLAVDEDPSSGVPCLLLAYALTYTALVCKYNMCIDMLLRCLKIDAVLCLTTAAYT